MDEQKNLELRLLEQVMTALAGVFPDVTPEASERPDFLFLEDTRVLGVEVTEYSQGDTPQGSPLRERQAVRRRICGEAAQEFARRHPDGPSVRVDVHFDGETPPHDLAVPLVELVEGHLPGQGKSTAIAAKPGQPLLRGWAWRVSIFNYEPIGTSHDWYPFDSGSLGWSQAEIQAFIDAKAKKVSDYLDRCDEVWLLIAALGDGIATTLLKPWGGEERLEYYGYGFGRVFILDSATAKAWELRLATGSV
jgi:hypothetical protein